MPPTGRPSFLNDAKRQVVCALLAKGGTLAEAAQLLGCTGRTLQREQRRNPQFRQQVKDARAQALLTPFQIMRRAARTNWRAASWMIERADAQRREQAELHSNDYYETLPDDERPSLLERLRRAAQQPSRTPGEIPPGFAEAFPKATAFIRALRARGAATKNGCPESQPSEAPSEP